MKHTPPPKKHTPPPKAKKETKKMPEDYSELQASIEAEQAAYESEQDDSIQPLAAAAVTQQPQFIHQLVVDLDFTVANPITLSHSFNSNMLYLSIINTGTAGNIAPSVAFTDMNTITLTGYASNTAPRKWRCFVTVLPPG